MTHAATAVRELAGSRGTAMDRFLAPWAEGLADRLSRPRGGVGAVLGPTGAGRERICRRALELLEEEGVARSGSLHLLRAGSGRPAGLVEQIGELAARGGLLRGAGSVERDALREALSVLSELREEGGVRLLMPLDPGILEGLEDEVERAFDLRLAVPTLRSEEVLEGLEERFRQEGIEGPLPPRAVARALALTGGWAGRLESLMETWGFGRTLAHRAGADPRELDAVFWGGVPACQASPTLHRVLQALGAPDLDGTVVQEEDRSAEAEAGGPGEPPASKALPRTGTEFSPVSGEVTGLEVTEGALVAVSNEGDPSEVRRRTLRRAASSGAVDDRVRAEIEAGLRDPNPGVRKAAIYALLEREDRDLARRLLPLAREGGLEDRRTALHALGRLAPAGAVQVSLEALEDAHAEVRQAAASALGALGGDGVVPALLVCLTDSQPGVRMSAESALLRLSETEGLTAFAEALSDAELKVRTGAAKLAGVIQHPDLKPLLLSKLTDEAAAVRRYAAASLGQMGDPTAVPVLVRSLQDPDPAVRESAEGAIVRLTGEGLGLALARILPTSEGETAEICRRLITELRPHDALEPLLELLDHPETRIRRTSAGLLGYLGDPRAIEPLLALHDRDWPEVGRAASASLVRLGVDGAAVRDPRERDREAG